MEAHALRQRGWSVSAIARHLDRDRKTVRAYLAGQREPGTRKPAGPEAVERAVPFAFLVQSLMIVWYAIAGDPAAGIAERRRCPWYTAKATPAPADMRTALRDALITDRISGISPGRNGSQKTSPRSGPAKPPRPNSERRAVLAAYLTGWAAQ